MVTVGIVDEVVLDLVIEIDHDVQEALYRLSVWRSFYVHISGLKGLTRKVVQSDIHHWGAGRTFLGSDLLIDHTSQPHSVRLVMGVSCGSPLASLSQDLRARIGDVGEGWNIFCQTIPSLKKPYATHRALSNA
jgi:hypothetical protein